MLHHGTNTTQAILIKEKSFEHKYEVGGKNKYIDLMVFNTLVIHNLVTFVFFVYLSLSPRAPLRLRGSFP